MSSLSKPAVPRLLSKLHPAALPPKTVLYFALLLGLRTLGRGTKIRRRTEDAAYVLVLAPVLMTLLHAGGRSKWPFSTKYRIFLDKLIWPAGISPRYEVMQDCAQFHPGTDSCVGSFFRDAPLSFMGLVRMYLRFYLVQFAVSYAVQALAFAVTESRNRWAHYLRDMRKQREREAELARLAQFERAGAMASESDSEEEEEEEEEEKLRRIDSAVDIGALGSFRSMTGLASSHKGRDRFVIAEQESKPAKLQHHDTAATLTDKRRRSSVPPPPLVPLTLSNLSLFLRRCLSSLPSQAFRYLEAVVRSTAYLWTGLMFIRLAYCALAAYDRRARGTKAADVSRYPLAVFLIQVLAAAGMVVERYSRVVIINRMLATYILGDLLPRSKPFAWAAAAASAAWAAAKAGGDWAGLGMGAFGALWSAVEM